MKTIKHTIAVAMLCIIALTISACGQKLDTNEIRKYSDDIAENILATLKTEDYKGHSKDYSDEMKKALTEEKFKNMCSTYKDKIGEYVSKEFVTVQSKQGYIIAIYDAKFTKDSNVIVRIVFKPNDENHIVQGEYYASKKLSSLH